MFVSLPQVLYDRVLYHGPVNSIVIFVLPESLSEDVKRGLCLVIS